MHEVSQIYQLEVGDAIDPSLLGVRVYDLDAGELLYELSGPPDFPSQIAFNDDGSILAGYYEVGWLYLWDMADGSVRSRIPTSPGLGTLTFLPGTTLLAQSSTGYQLPMVLVYDTETGHIVSTVLNRFTSMAVYREFIDSRMAMPITLLNMHPLADGETIIAATSFDEVLRWNLTTGEQLTLVGSPDSRPNFGITGMALTTDEQTAVALNSQQDTITRIDLAASQVQETVEFGEVPLLGMGALLDDNTLAYMTGERGAEVINVAPLSDLKAAAQFDLRTLVDLPEELVVQLRITDLAASSDGNRLVLAGFFYRGDNPEDNRIVVLDR
ncbi:MAG: hypothetical protein CL607_28450 [Anaerolineaceae bacterium]|nr:hypothetical protein [Anaerolineaceae bacterium]